MKKGKRQRVSFSNFEGRLDTLEAKSPSILEL